MTALFKSTITRTFRDPSRFPGSLWGQKFLVSALAFGFLSATWPPGLAAYQDAQDQSQQPAQQQPAPAPQYAQNTPDQLQQLVAPIALYPDSLVAQILAASTFPDQV